VRKLLVKVRDKEVALNLKQFGEIEEVSSIFNIYSVNVSENRLIEFSKVEGILNIEEDEVYEVQLV
jgi:hypothetical protein